MDQLARVVTRCRELIAHPAARLPPAAAADPAWEGIVLSGSSDGILRERLAPERARQLDGLYQAIVRMLAVIDA